MVCGVNCMDSDTDNMLSHHSFMSTMYLALFCQRFVGHRFMTNIEEK